MKTAFATPRLARFVSILIPCEPGQPFAYNASPPFEVLSDADYLLGLDLDSVNIETFGGEAPPRISGLDGAWVGEAPVFVSVTKARTRLAGGQIFVFYTAVAKRPYCPSSLYAPAGWSVYDIQEPGDNGARKFRLTDGVSVYGVTQWPDNYVSLACELRPSDNLPIDFTMTSGIRLDVARVREYLQGVSNDYVKLGQFQCKDCKRHFGLSRHTRTRHLNFAGDPAYASTVFWFFGGKQLKSASIGDSSGDEGIGVEGIDDTDQGVIAAGCDGCLRCGCVKVTSEQLLNGDVLETAGGFIDPLGE